MKFFNVSILELREKIIRLPCNERYEFFKRSTLQEILKNFDAFDAKAIVNLFELFPPIDAYEFLQSSFIRSKLNEINSYDIDCEDILSYFKDEEIKRSVKSLLDKQSLYLQPNNNSDTNISLRN